VIAPVRRAIVVAVLAMPMPVMAQEAHDHHAHEGSGMATMPMNEPTSAPEQGETVGDAEPPPVPNDHAADAVFGASRMTEARDELLREDHVRYSQLLVERLELQSGEGATGWGWEGEASTGDDRDRLVIASEGEVSAGSRDRVELQAKWRTALDPWFSAEIGVRHDLSPDPQRTYLVLGVEGLAPYWIDTDAQLFLSNKGDVQARFQAGYDQRLTQRLVLRGEAEIDVALQKVPELGITSHIPEFSVGGRLRYEITPIYAPYIGVELRREPQACATARDRSSVNVVFGVRGWF
jgi:copper resistance protein B